MTKGISYQQNDQSQNTLETPKRAHTTTPEEDDFLNDPNVRRITNKTPQNGARKNLLNSMENAKGNGGTIYKQQWNNYQQIEMNQSNLGNSNTNVSISQQALRFAVNDRFPPLKIECNPKLLYQQNRAHLVKEFVKDIEQNFRQVYPRYQRPLGFDHFDIDRNGDLLCNTNSIEIFIFLSENKHYPASISNTQLKPILPLKLPVQHVIIIKFIDNNLSTLNQNLLILQFLIRKKVLQAT
ncbi:unnamed protein product [Didymodactylos carnosus]|uniref:Uncharacterized protein n=1 Tax=Didymodactylos carnosus TaxID=1234261 RepID=A0A8S2E617_9BILA|nr:unnamed protein product [Didymodactylos carnosus]CAF3852349.1 unnamed protein product [Didymodactylos carnosus]